MAKHLEGHSAAGISQSNSAVRGVLDEIELGKAADHLGHRRRFDPKPTGEILRADPSSFTTEEKDLFEVILLRLRQIRSLGGAYFEV
jgi:hypothetical protein